MKTTDYRTEFDGGIVTAFVRGLEFGFDKNEFDEGNGVNLKINLENSNVFGEVYIDGVDFPFNGVNLYVEYQNIVIIYLQNLKTETQSLLLK